MTSSSSPPAGEPGWGAVIGIGLNVNLGQDCLPPELRERATSIQIERSGLLADRSELARDLIRRLDQWYDASCRDGASVLNSSWRARSELLGQVVRVATTSAVFTARLVDLDVSLGLTLDLQNVSGPPPADSGPASLTRLPLAEIRQLEAIAGE